MDAIDLDRRAGEVVAAVMAATSPDQQTLPTPCPDWPVGDLIVHLVVANVKYRDIGLGADWWRGLPDVQVTEDPRAAYPGSLAELLDAWRQPGALEREVTLPPGPRPAEWALYIHLGETIVHGWDLSVATGIPVPFDDDIVEASLTQYMRWLPERRVPGSPFGNAVPAPADASLVERHAAFLGRDVTTWRS